MKFEMNGNELRIFVDGRIDSTNADQFNHDLFEIIDQNPHENLVLDFDELMYISSAGLRVILKTRKKEDTLHIINTSRDVYEVFELTGFTEMMPIEKAYRKFSIEGCDILGQGSNGIVYRYDPEIVIKVYRNPDAINDIQRERELARKALVLGIPTAIPFDVVKVDDKFASVFELLNATSFSKLIKKDPDNIDQYIDLFSNLARQINSTVVDPHDMPDMKAVALNWAKDLNGVIPENQYEKLIHLISEVEDRKTMIHGDFHTNNVEMQNGEVLLIDMDTLSYGHPVFELASMFLGFVGFSSLDHEAVTRFLGITYEQSTYVWHEFLKKYLETEDESKITEVENKARVVAYTRLLRRTIRRESDTETGQKLIAFCKEQLGGLLDTVDTLNF